MSPPPKQQRSLFWEAFVISVVISLSWYSRYRTISSLPPIPSQPEKHHFSVSNARNYLTNLTSLGPRVTGTRVNEVDTVQYLIKALDEIKRSAVPGVSIEIEVQHPSSHFFLDFLGGMTNVYNNITNVIAKISWKSYTPKETRATLINAHFDSVPGSPGASDDGVGVACMLETLRALSQESELKQPIIFLFNGAEESMMQGAHGFITQHRWADSVQFVLNLEAMGSGGKEMMFQCNSEWMASFYLKNAQYPFANVLANELFSLLLWRIAATDFRTFLSHGKSGIVGIDTAYILNGYVYHTSYDRSEVVEDGTLHHTGGNILSLSRALSLTTEFPEPSGVHAASENTHSPGPIDSASAVYFDLFGWYFSYSGKFLIFALHLTVGIIGLYTMRTIWLSNPQQIRPSYSMFLWRCFLNETYCIGCCIVANIGIAIVFHFICPMIWYDNGLFVAFLFYVPPTLLVSHYIRTKNQANYSHLQGLANIISLWLFILCICIFLNLMLGYVACLFLLSIVIVFQMTKSINLYMLHRAPVLGFDRSKLIQFFASYSYEIFQFPILHIWWAVFFPLFQVLVPILGRTGTVVPGDIILSVLVSFAISLGWNLCLINTIGTTLRPGIVRSAWMIYGIFIAFFVIFHTSYSLDHPKRLWIQHVQREFYMTPEATAITDHGLWVSGFDGTGLSPLLSSSEHFPQTSYYRNQRQYSLRSSDQSRVLDTSEKMYSCRGWNGDCYFRYPYSYPVADALQDYMFLPSKDSPPRVLSPNKLQLQVLESSLSQTHSRSKPRRRVFSITLLGSTHMNLVVRESSFCKVTRWGFPTLENFDQYSHLNPPPPEELLWQENQIQRPDGVHYVLIGFGSCLRDICKQKVFLEVMDEAEGHLEIAAYSHYMGEKDPTILEYIRTLPKWAIGAEWSQYQSHLVVRYV